jgi:hypothetical protein
MMLEDNEFWSMSIAERSRTVELEWKEATAAMSADDFKSALQHLAAHISEQGADATLVDVRRFRFRMTPELDGWRLEHIIPAYNEAGLARFAYLLPPGVPYRPSAGGDAARFETGYFERIDEARDWLRAT